MPRLRMGYFAIPAIALVVLVSSVYIVDIRERAILLRLGEMVVEDAPTGLNWKIPVVDTVRKFDKRLQTLDINPERFLTLEKKNLIVDFYVKWLIDDVGQYYRATGGSQLVAAQRLEQIVKDGLRSEFGKRTVQEAVSGERAEIMDVITVNANKQVEALGVSVREVRIKRMDLPNEVSTSVFARMEAERARTAKELRAEGREQAERIRSEADRRREVILAEAYRDGEKIRGKGDATAAEIYARAYGSDPEFYSFYRSMSAYRESMARGDNVLVMEPEGQFFRYFSEGKGTGGTP
ncbi:MAG: protease modulator HflC [Pseudomonadota bacterium]|nr:protease modulator HflC [Pseudomonadota bacterium]